MSWSYRYPRDNGVMTELPGTHLPTIEDRLHVGRTVESSSRPFEGKVVNVRIDEVRLFDGKDAVRRDVVEHPGAAAVIAVNDENEVAFIKQYRHPVEGELWEVPAGLLDVEGEDPKETACRELAEEVDLVAGRLDKLLTLALSPGGSNEVIHIYLATDLEASEETFERNDEEAEFELTWVPIERALDAVTSGKIRNATTVTALFAAHYRLSGQEA